MSRGVSGKTWWPLKINEKICDTEREAATWYTSEMLVRSIACLDNLLPDEQVRNLRDQYGRGHCRSSGSTRVRLGSARRPTRSPGVAAIVFGASTSSGRVAASE